MFTYNDFEKAVFDWLMSKHLKNSAFTFSVRQNANKGAEKDYFIGTSNSGYFGTTFWYVPIAYPGSSSDLINLIFRISDAELSYYIQFNQTRKPHNDQNKYALAFLQRLKPILKKSFSNYSENAPSNKMEFFKIGDNNTHYSSVEELLKNVDKDLSKLIPIIDGELQSMKARNPGFEGSRITEEQFNLMQARLNNRFEKYNEKIIKGDGVTATIKLDQNIRIARNQILYGPPGTGKTYNAINKAIAIANPGFDLTASRNDIKAEYDRMVTEKQIVFTTFHQSLSYEDFIEGIKPVSPDEGETSLQYEVQDGIFKRLCTSAKASAVGNFDEAFDKLYEQLTLKQDGELLKLKTANERVFGISANSRGSLSLHKGLDFKKIGGLTREGMKKELNGEKYYDRWIGFYNTVIGYLTENFGFKKGISAGSKNYVLIIDEINRGNVSQIFGELITLIEENKRSGEDESLEVILPYSKEKFSVPPNLYIIGTMNTADRSVEALDAALRRRFSFEEMLPKPDLVSPYRQIWNLLWEYNDYEWDEEPYRTKEQELFDFLGIMSARDEIKEIWDGFEDDGQLENQIQLFEEITLTGVDLERLLVVINKRIVKILDRDHQIGHSYFMNVSNIGDLQAVFYDKIIPLLQEYFFGDYGKLGLVLGKGFIRKIEAIYAESVFADFEYESRSELEQREVYEIIDYRQTSKSNLLRTTSAFENIENKSIQFKDAIRLLMNLPLN